MIIPNLNALPSKFVEKDGNINANWHTFFDQLITQMQNNLSEEGVQIPLVTNNDLTQMTGKRNIGRLVFNTDTNQMMIGYQA